MSALKFDVYRKNDLNAVLDEVIEIDVEAEDPATVQQVLNRVNELKSDKTAWISPANDESAWVLLRGKKRGGRKGEVDPEIVRFVHNEYVNEETPLNTIAMKIYAKFEKVLRPNVVRSILDQNRGTDVDGIDDLRELAKAKLETAGKGRQKHSEADKAEWVRMHLEDGMSGSAIGKQLDINSATINAHLKKEGVQQNGRGRIKQVVAEQVG